MNLRQQTWRNDETTRQNKTMQSKANEHLKMRENAEDCNYFRINQMKTKTKQTYEYIVQNTTSK